MKVWIIMFDSSSVIYLHLWVTCARNLKDHLGKRGSPDLNSVCNWNLKRPNSTSACAIIDFGRFWARYSYFQGEKLILPHFSMSRGVAGSLSFPEVQNRKETESGVDPHDKFHVCKNNNVFYEQPLSDVSHIHTCVKTTIFARSD